MTQEAGIKVGDVVAWGKVPDGALVRTCDGGYFLRVGGCGECVGRLPLLDRPNQHAQRWLWPSDRRKRDGEPLTIVALDLTGDETAADLQRLAEVFEVREALFVAESRGWLCVVIGAGTAAPMILAEGDDLGTVAERLHAAGWRPGMTAEDAARLLGTSAPMGRDAFALRCACGTVPHFYPCLCAPWVLFRGLPCECGATNFRIHACPTCHTTIGLAGAAELVARAWLHAVIPGWPRPGTGGSHG